MPNRIIKESVCISEDLNQLTWFEEVTFYRLLTACDDYGRMDGRTAILIARLFPLKDCVSKKMLEDAVAHLVRIGILRQYTVDTKPYLEFTNWGKHQRMRDAREKYPADCGESPQFAASCGESPQFAASCGESPRVAASLRKVPQVAARAGAESESESESESETIRRAPLAVAFDAFRESREKSRRKLTAKAEQMIRTKLEELAPNNPDRQAMILNQSTMNGWAGVFPLREDKQPDHRARKSNPAGNFTQREYSDEYLDQMYDAPPTVSAEELSAAKGEVDLPPMEEE